MEHAILKRSDIMQLFDRDNPTQMILCHLPDNPEPFVTWMRVFPSKKTPFNTSGHYFNDLQAALDDFKARTAQSNKE